jgi:hypothetical protein
MYLLVHKYYYINCIYSRIKLPILSCIGLVASTADFYSTGLGSYLRPDAGRSH